MALAVCLRMLWSESVDSGQGGDLAHTLGQMSSGDQVTPGDSRWHRGDGQMNCVNTILHNGQGGHSQSKQEC